RHHAVASVPVDRVPDADVLAEHTVIDTATDGDVRISPVHGVVVHDANGHTGVAPERNDVAGVVGRTRGVGHHQRIAAAKCCVSHCVVSSNQGTPAPTWQASTTGESKPQNSRIDSGSFVSASV